jgi:hypothetical protein
LFLLAEIGGCLKNSQKKLFQTIGKFPLRIGTPSFIFPVDLMSNVENLAPFVNSIQLLYFESSRKMQLEHRVDLQRLKELQDEYQLAYTVHLPIDINLGDENETERKADVHEIIFLVQRLSVLDVTCFDLHLEPAADYEFNGNWLERLEKSLVEIKNGLGELAGRVGVENLGKGFRKLWPLARKYNLATTIDLGHLTREGETWQKSLDVLLPSTSHIHLHGVSNGRDHQPLGYDLKKELQFLGAELLNYPEIILTLEVYKLEHLCESLTVLNRVWDKSSLEKINQG